MSELVEVMKNGKKYRINEAEREAWLNDGAKEIMPKGEIEKKEVNHNGK